MKNININNQTCIPISSNCVVWQGNDIKCIPDGCSNRSITEIVQFLGDVSCFNYDQLNSLATVSLGCFSTELACSDKTLVNLFDLAFEQLCVLQEQIVQVSAGEPPKLVLDFCTPVSYSCEDPCLFPVPCCSADEGQTISDILQALVGRIVKHSLEICNLFTIVTDLQDQIDAIIAATGVIYIPPKVTLICDAYWNGTTYIPSTGLPIEMDLAITVLDKDTCKIKNILGDATDLKTNRDFKCLDPIDNTIVYHNYSSATNVLEVQNLMQSFLCDLKLQLNALQTRQDECCRTDCDTCMDNYFNNIRVNYGEIAAGIATTPYITIDHHINTQVMATCVGNALLLSSSYYLISDGAVTKQIMLDDLVGINIISGSISTSATLQFDLAALGLDYLKDITIKLHVKTVLDCIDSYRGLVPRFDNPDCDTCMICINKLDFSDPNDYSIDFDLNYIGGAFIGYTSHYQLNTSSPCVTIERKLGQTITISNVNNPNAALVQLCSDCDFLGLPACCQDGANGGETPVIADSCWKFNLPASLVLSGAIDKGIVQSLPLSPNPDFTGIAHDAMLDLDILDINYVYDYTKIITYVSPSGDPISGKILSAIITNAGGSGGTDQANISVEVPVGLPSYIPNCCGIGTATAVWDTSLDIKASGYTKFAAPVNESNMSIESTGISGTQEAALDSLVPDGQFDRKFGWTIEKDGSDFALKMKIEQQPIDKTPYLVLTEPITGNIIHLAGILNNPVTNCDC